MGMVLIAPRIQRVVKRGLRAIVPGMSERHLELIRQCHCCVCWAEPPVDPHHLLRVAGEGVKGIGRRHRDKWAIPLCVEHHLAPWPHAVHTHGDDEEKLTEYGIDGRALATALWSETGDLDAMERVNFAHHQRGCLLVAQRELAQ